MLHEKIHSKPSTVVNLPLPLKIVLILSTVDQKEKPKPAVPQSLLKKIVKHGTVNCQRLWEKVESSTILKILVSILTL